MNKETDVDNAMSTIFSIYFVTMLSNKLLNWGFCN